MVGMDAPRRGTKCEQVCVHVCVQRLETVLSGSSLRASLWKEERDGIRPSPRNAHTFLLRPVSARSPPRNLTSASAQTDLSA